MELAKERTEIRERKYRETNGEKRREREMETEGAEARRRNDERERMISVSIYRSSTTGWDNCVGGEVAIAHATGGEGSHPPPHRPPTGG